MTKRDALFREIQGVLANHGEAEIIDALVACLVVAIGVSSVDMAQADAMIGGLPVHLKTGVRQGWDGFRKHRASADFRARFEAGVLH